jgi:hypothetical protein
MLLTSVRHLVLTNSVLGSLAIHFMSCLLLPKTVIYAFDCKCCAVIWTEDDKRYGSQCLIAWERQNHCLLPKFVHKLYCPGDFPLKPWFLHFLRQVPDDRLPDSFADVGRILFLAPPHDCQVGRWQDSWLTFSPLSETFPTLFPHNTRAWASAYSGILSSLDLNLRLHLTSAASHNIHDL